MRNTHRPVTALAALIALCPMSLSPRVLADETARPAKINVLFIAVDDLNDWVGCLKGHPQAQTPNIDRLAKRGILFNNAHCTSPACNPSRAAVFSGKMPWKTGVWSNQSKKLLQQHPEMQVLPRAFGRAGYSTLGTGKLMHSAAQANRLMFDEHFHVEQRWSPFTRDAVEYTEDELPSKKTSNPRHELHATGLEPVRLPLNRMPSDRKPDSAAGESFDWGPLDVPDSSMGDTRITNWAIEKLKTKRDQPIFMGVGFYRPHIPLWAPKAYFDRFKGQEIQLPPYLESDLNDLGPSGQRWATEAVTAGLHSTVVKFDQWQEAVKSYLACTTYVDFQIGRLLDALDNGPYAKNTVVVLWSDHGWHLGEKQHWGKWTPWERSTRVVLMVVPPRNMAGRFTKLGQGCHQPVSLLDLYPTLTELCDVPAPKQLEGKSLIPLLQDPQRSTGRVVLTSFDRGNVSLRSDRWRYIRYDDRTEELYDMHNDPNEWTNLAGESGREELLRQFRQQIPLDAL